MNYLIAISMFVFTQLAMAQTLVPEDYEESGNVEVTTGTHESTEVITDEKGNKLGQKKTVSKINETTVGYSNEKALKKKAFDAQTKAALRPLTGTNKRSLIHNCSKAFISSRTNSSLDTYYEEKYCSQLSSNEVETIKAEYSD